MNSFFDRKEIFVRREPFIYNRLEVLLCGHQRMPPDTEIFTVADPIAMRILSQADMFLTKPATFELDPAAGQQLIDELWRCGLRPTEGTGSAGAMAAVERHLEDMRRLAFKGAVDPLKRST